MAEFDTIAAKTDWTTSDSNYTFWGAGYANIDPDIPTWTQYLGYENVSADSVWLRTNITPSKLYYFKKDSGSVMSWNPDEYTADPGKLNFTRIYGALDSTGGIIRTMQLVPFGDWQGVDGFNKVTQGNVPTVNTQVTPVIDPSQSAKGFTALMHKERGSTDSVYLFRNDTLKFKAGQTTYTFHDITHPLYLSAFNYLNFLARGFFKGRNIFFALGGGVHWAGNSFVLYPFTLVFYTERSFVKWTSSLPNTVIFHLPFTLEAFTTPSGLVGFKFH
jgi:hypothetical protein